MGLTTRKAEPTMNHANRAMAYYDVNPNEIEKLGGVDVVIAQLKARLGRRNTREMIAWEIAHEVDEKSFKPVWEGWDYPTALKEFRERHAPNRVKEWYASGQRERANGVAEYLRAQGEDVKVVRLPDGERHRNRKYIVVG
jgi:hypothetical protein